MRTRTRSRSLSLRLAATAVVMVAAGAAATCTASAATQASAADGADYKITIATDKATTDYDNRRVTVSGTLTTADGTPVPNAPVDVNESVLFTTWNPWGDPIDPNYTETQSLGPITTDADGKFSIPDVSVDHVGASSLLDSAHEVDFSAYYDVDGDPNTPIDGYYAQTAVNTKTLASTLTYSLNKTKVKAGDILTVQGKVTLPKGEEPSGAEVFLRTYWESEYRVKADVDEDGSFVMSAKIRDYDNEFVLMSAPVDYYTAGQQIDLPVTNTSLPQQKKK